MRTAQPIINNSGCVRNYWIFHFDKYKKVEIASDGGSQRQGRTRQYSSKVLCVEQYSRRSRNSINAFPASTKACSTFRSKCKRSRCSSSVSSGTSTAAKPKTKPKSHNTSLGILRYKTIPYFNLLVTLAGKLLISGGSCVLMVFAIDNHVAAIAPQPVLKLSQRNLNWVQSQRLM
jgi:hypothetical protein